jgi:hypothetical protein
MHELGTGAAVALWVVLAVSAAGKVRSAEGQRSFAALAGLAGAVVALLLIRLDDLVELFAPPARAGASRTARS